MYHLGQAILCGLARLLACDNKHLHAHLYTVVMDLQEAFGWIITLFNDKLGSYLVQESLFHKECYSLSLKPIKPGAAYETQSDESTSDTFAAEERKRRDAETLFNGTTLEAFKKMSSGQRQAYAKHLKLDEAINALGGANFYKKLEFFGRHQLQRFTLANVYLQDEYFVKALNGVEAQLTSDLFEEMTNISLHQFSHLPAQERGKFIEHHKLQSVIDRMGEQVFYTKLEQAIPEVLENVPIRQLANYPHWLIDCLLKSTEEVRGIRVADLEQMCMPQILVTKLQIESLEVSSETESGSSDVLELSLLDFVRLPGERIENEIDKLPKNALFFLPSSMIMTLNLSKFTAEQIKKLFDFIDMKARLSLLSGSQLQPILHLMPDNMLSCLSKKQLEGFNDAKLTSDQRASDTFKNHL